MALAIRSSRRLCVFILIAGLILSCSGQDTSRQPAGGGTNSARQNAGSDPCALLSESDIAGVVGNPVSKGRRFATGDDCKWDTDEPGNVDVLLIAHAPGSIRAQVLCPDLQKADSSHRVQGLGDVAVWKYSSEGSLFNSGDLEVCGPKGYVSLTLQGKRDEAALKRAAIDLARKAIERM